MGVGGQDGFIALAKEIRRARREQAERMERRRQRVEERMERLRSDVEEDTGRVDPMACPCCGTLYAFGDNCPVCGRSLVCSGMIDAELSAVREHRTLGSYPALGLILVGAATAAFGLVCIALFALSF